MSYDYTTIYLKSYLAKSDETLFVCETCQQDANGSKIEVRCTFVELK